MDPFLKSVLATSTSTRDQCLALLDIEEAQLLAQDVPATEDTKLKRSKQQKTLNSHLSKLRGLNRSAVLAVRDTKHHTSEARSEIDTLHLQLQNLYYEQRHLRGEIDACESYECVYTTM